jgi:hypothetical protein
MSSGAWVMLAATAVSLGALLFIIGTLIRSIRNERTPGREVWREKLGTLPGDSPRPASADGWKLPDAPVETG